MSNQNGTPTATPPQASQALTPYQARAMELREEIGQDAAPRAIVPRTFAEAQAFASAMATSALVPEKLRDRAPDVLMIILAGAEHGIPPIRALTLFHVVEGVPKLSADGVAGLVTAHPLCEYLEPREQNDERVTWVAKKHGRPELVLTWDKAAATRAGLWGKRNWAGYPRQMLNARCKAELCRLVFPEVTAGLVTAEEARDQLLAAEVAGVPAAIVAPPPPPAPPAVPTDLPRDTSKQGDSTPAGGKAAKATTKPAAAKPPIDVASTPSSSSSAPASSSTSSASSSNSSSSAASAPPTTEANSAGPLESSSAPSTESSSSTEPAPSVTSAPAVTLSTSGPSSASSSPANAADDAGGFGGDEEPAPAGKTIEGFRAAVAGATKETIEAVKNEWLPWSMKGQPGHEHVSEMRSLFGKKRAELGLK